MKKETKKQWLLTFEVFIYDNNQITRHSQVFTNLENVFSFIKNTEEDTDLILLGANIEPFK